MRLPAGPALGEAAKPAVVGRSGGVLVMLKTVSVRALCSVSALGAGLMLGGTAQAGTVFNFTGSEASFTTPTRGYYIVEAWGAAGGTENAAGGLGAFIDGIAKLSAGEKLT